VLQRNNIKQVTMKIKQEIDRVLTEYNFDRMSFDEASKQLFDLYVVVASDFLKTDHKKEE
jgi:hypothetical protein